MTKTVTITSIVWLTLAVCGVMLSQKESVIAEMSVEHYRTTPHAEWIRLPDDARNIFAASSGFRDVHYTVVRFSTTAKSLEPYLLASLDNRRRRDEKVYSVRDLRFSLDFLFDVFIYDSTLLPGWWVNYYPQNNPESILMFWDSGSRGCGYIGLLDKELGEARIFHFSQQHLHWDQIERAIKQYGTANHKMKTTEPNRVARAITDPRPHTTGHTGP